ncbi:MAG: prepilin-type N-terminal cleavage/methylation domain-containing protein, partial [Gammaproteobacteria bacterium]|nr:prepilin-type N-terminal cleavage/methylation domain-containing protein [Gammaproteobacteria bacterium]
MKIKNNSVKYSNGLTLVELMVAMVISGILMLGIVQIFSTNSRSYKVQDENARMQESGRYAFNTLMTDIRRAGYLGGNANIEDITGSLGVATPTRTCDSATTNWGRMIQRGFYGLNDGNTDTDADSQTVDYTGCIPNADYLRGDIIVTRYTKGNALPAATEAATLAANPNRLYIRNSLFVGRLFK